jgi:hypothetical protein
MAPRRDAYALEHAVRAFLMFFWLSCCHPEVDKCSIVRFLLR